MRSEVVIGSGKDWVDDFCRQSLPSQSGRVESSNFQLRSLNAKYRLSLCSSSGVTSSPSLTLPTPEVIPYRLHSLIESFGKHVGSSSFQSSCAPEPASFATEQLAPCFHNGRDSFESKGRCISSIFQSGQRTQSRDELCIFDCIRCCRKCKQCCQQGSGPDQPIHQSHAR